MDFIHQVLPNYMLVALHASIPPKSFFFDSQAFLCLPIFHGPPNVVKAAGAKRSAVIRTRACQAQPTRHCPWRGWTPISAKKTVSMKWSTVCAGLVFPHVILRSKNDSCPEKLSMILNTLPKKLNGLVQQFYGSHHQFGPLSLPKSARTNEIARNCKKGIIGHRQQLVLRQGSQLFPWLTALFARFHRHLSSTEVRLSSFGTRHHSIRSSSSDVAKTRTSGRSSFGTHASLLVTPEMLVFCDGFCQIEYCKYPGT